MQRIRDIFRTDPVEVASDFSTTTNDPLPEVDDLLDDTLTPEEEDQLDDVLDEMERHVVEPEILPRQVEHGTLIAGSGTTRMMRDQLRFLPVPESTSTFQPISHNRLVDTVEEALAFRHIAIVNSDFAISNDGMKMFCLLEVNSEYEGVRFAIALRTANDKSMRLAMVSGYRVFCCSNMSMSGDFHPLNAKHSKHFDLTESVAIAIDRIQRKWQPLREAIDFKRRYELSDNFAKQIIYDAFIQCRLPAKLFQTVHREVFVNPSHEEFTERTMWSLENAMTTSFKKLRPVQQYIATARLGKFLAPHSQAF